MYGYDFTNDDQFLNFAGVSALIFDNDGKLTALKAANGAFRGWEASNFYAFELEKHFLTPNQLTWEQLKKQIQFEQDGEREFIWCYPGGAKTPPLSTFWQYKPAEETSGQYIAFVRDSQPQPQPETALQNKKYFYQAYNLPGFIHNISGPLGVIFGRTELLKYKHPEITDFEEMLRTSRRLRAIIENFNLKISSERYAEEVPINLNRFLKQELTFLNSDLFFKHRVAKEEDFSVHIPEFPTNYATLSAVISECYYFFRQYCDENRRYDFSINTFWEDKKVGFQMSFTGDFSSPAQERSPLPFHFEGTYQNLPHAPSSTVDSFLLAECLRSHQGEIQLSCDKEKLSLRYQFPLPENSGRNRLQ